MLMLTDDCHITETYFSNMAVVCQQRHAVRFNNVAVVCQQRHEVCFNNVAVCMIRFCVWLISTPVSSTCEWLLLRLSTVTDTRNKHCSVPERRVNLWGRHFRAVIVKGELNWRQKLTLKCWKCPNIFICVLSVWLCYQELHNRILFLLKLIF